MQSKTHQEGAIQPSSSGAIYAFLWKNRLNSVDVPGKGDGLLFLESNEQQLAKYNCDRDDGGIVPERARPIKTVQVMYESEKC